jgi:subtilisin-like proprotein convertase family protein
MNRIPNRLHVLASLAAGVFFAGCSGSSSGNKPDRFILVSQVPGPTTESGEQVTFTVALNAKPSADVHIALSSSDSTEGTVSPAELVFTKSNFAAPQSVVVAGVDDDEADGNAVFQVVFAVTSTDVTYGHAQLPDVPVTNLDDETAGIRVGPASAPTTEAGGSASVPVRLQSRPTADVLLIFGSSDPSEGSASVQTLTFTPDDWNAPQDIVITGVDDPSADGAQDYSLIFQTSASEDPHYAGLPIPAVPLTNLDNDSAGVLFNTASIVTSENLNAATFTVRLASQPTAAVILNVAGSDSTEGGVSPTTLSFTTSNWNVPQTVTVTGKDDSLLDGDQPFTVGISAVTSLDPKYASLAGTITPVQALNLDNDSAGIRTTSVTNATSESGMTATLTVKLASQPTANVVIPVSTTDATEGTVSPSSLTFTTSNFGTPQTVTVRGPVDFMRDGQQTYQVAFGAAASSDVTYNGMQAAPLDGVNIDDGPIKTALVYDDGFGTYADDAMAALGYTVMLVNDPAAFDSAFDTTALDWILVESSVDPLPVSTESRLAAWASSGNGLVLSYWDLDGSATLQSALDVSAVSYSTFRNVFPHTGATPNLFGAPNAFNAPLVGQDIVADNGQELTLTGGGSILADLDMDGGPGAIAFTNSASSMVIGFAPDDSAGEDSDFDGLQDVEELYLNAIAALRTGGQPLSPQQFDNTTPIAIPDASSFIESTIDVPLGVTLTNVKVALHITHTFDADLDISLIGPDGTTIDVSSDNGSSGDNYGTACDLASMTTFDDGAGTAATAGTAPFSGSFQPEQPLATYAGRASAGTWTLHVADDLGGDVGTLECWSLILSF